MNNLNQTRKEAGMTQSMLEELTGIPQQNLSALEHGKFKPNQSTREKIEKVLGKIDWLETEKMNPNPSTYFEAERVIKKLVVMTSTMSDKEKQELKNLIYKYF